MSPVNSDPIFLNSSPDKSSILSTVGILGGSFNPAHAGHLDISLLALEKLDLDSIWWMVTPQNPLKSTKGMASLSQRLSTAQQAAEDPRIKVTDIESKLGTLYTFDTLRTLCDRFSKVRFVWLMGADNLLQMHRWQQWQQIFLTVPIAVFARPNYSAVAETAEATKCFAEYRLPVLNAQQLARKQPPAWVFFKKPLNPISSTELRGYNQNN